MKESSFIGRGKFCFSQIFGNRMRGRESEQWRKMPSDKFPMRAAKETGCLQLLLIEHPTKPMKIVRYGGVHDDTWHK